MAVSLVSTGVQFPDSTIQTTAAGGGGAWTYISTVTATNSVFANVTWTSTENALYDMIVIIATDVQADQSNTAMLAQFYVGGTVDANNNYSYTTTYSTSSFFSITNLGSSSSYMWLSANSLGFTGNAANNASFLIYIPSPGSSAKYPNCYSFGYMNRNNAGPLMAVGESAYATGTVTGMRFFTSANQFNTGTFRVYGIKKS